MASKREREIQWALDFRRQVTEARLSRREIMKLGVLGTGTAFLGLGSTAAGAQDLISPPTRLFVEPMPVPKTVHEAGFEVTADQFAAHGAGLAENDPRTAAWKAKHQYSHRFEPKRFYIVPMRENRNYSFHEDLPPNTVWGYGGAYPGVTMVANYGEPIVCRIPNELPLDHDTSFGIPQVITHLHNFHSGSESDGGPWGFYDIGQFRDHYYTMARAGFTDPQFQAYYDNNPRYNGDNWGDPRETLNTMFYHSHRPDFTTANVYKGQAGMFIAYDELDTGNENTGLRLPSGKYDVPLAMADKVFDGNGQAFFDAFNLDGIIGDKPMVNGKIQPYFDVDRRRYRFRFLNTGPSRIARFFLYNATQGRWIKDPFLQIASDGNLLQNPVLRGSVQVAVAERYDMLVDFRRIANDGDRIVMYNRLEQKDGRRPTGKLLAPGVPIMQFRVGGIVPDASYDYFANPGAVLREQPTINLAEVVRERTWELGRGGGAWTINGQIFDPAIEATQARVRRNTAEIWHFENGSGGWVHPMHIHFEEHRVLKRNGVTPAAFERGRKDVVLLGRGEKVSAFFRFRDFPDPDFNPPNPAYKPEAGRYALHCHNTVHEDHAMMARWDIVNEDPA